MAVVLSDLELFDDQHLCLRKFEIPTFLGPRAITVFRYFLKSLTVGGDICECGVYEGETSVQLTRYLEHSDLGKIVHLFDSFEGLPNIITSEDCAGRFAEAQVGLYRCPKNDVVRRFDGLRQFLLHEGLFSETLPQFTNALAFIHADADLYASTREIISFADRCLSPDGIIVFDDYMNPRYPGVTTAIVHDLNPARYQILPLAETLQCVARKLRV